MPPSKKMAFCFFFSLALAVAFVSRAVAPREQVTGDAMRVCRTTWVLVLSELEKKIIIMGERTRQTIIDICNVHPSAAASF
ncbi:hypothetical protein BDR05DRAFT_954300 [Suillus weaverae]|nr:hypothetical protein BDR05DRAFT_954300 [Suillus weaverae]